MANPRGPRHRPCVPRAALALAVSVAVFCSAVTSWAYGATDTMVGSWRPVELADDHGPVDDHGRIVLLTVRRQRNIEALAGVKAPHWGRSEAHDVAADVRFEDSDTLRSAEDAWTAAAQYMGTPVSYRVYGEVHEVDGPAAAAGIVPGDRVVSVNGTDLDGHDGERDNLRLLPGTTSTVRVVRGSRAVDVDVTMPPAPDDADDRLGLRRAGALMSRHAEVTNPHPHAVVPTTERGPSSGLAHALAMVDVLGHGDLTGGETVAVTGAISMAGWVTRISSVQAKTEAAVHAGASVLLVPLSDARDATEAARGRLEVIGVGHLDDAIAELCQRAQARSVRADEACSKSGTSPRSAAA
jgi:PDZ domain-containing secreted protein